MFAHAPSRADRLRRVPALAFDAAVAGGAEPRALAVRVDAYELCGARVAFLAHDSGGPTEPAPDRRPLWARTDEYLEGRSRARSGRTAAAHARSNGRAPVWPPPHRAVHPPLPPAPPPAPPAP